MYLPFNRVIFSVPTFDNSQTIVIPSNNTGVDSCDLEKALTDNTINKPEIQNVTEHEDITSRSIIPIIPAEFQNNSSQNNSSVVSCNINAHILIFSFL